ncbi:MAG TPA: TolC family protein, partial [Gemmatimonadaceae bacterium]|nr:TolC family protein [Gemmatimonadaceae bacterium]
MNPIRLLPALALCAAAVLPAQTLTLRDALARADGGAYANRIAAGTAAAQRGPATAALRGILPSLRFEGGYVRTDDPIGAFGTTLRQRTITQADFDPARLNRPAAIGNYQGGIVLEQPLVNADAWTGRMAAARGLDASRSSADWTRLGTRVDVIRAYYGVTLAREKAATLAAATRAAQAHQRQAEAMVRQGLATKSDALLAAVKAGELEAQQAEADADARTATRQLALVLGAGDGALPALPERLPTAEQVRAVVADDTTDLGAAVRADVRAATLGQQAARLDVRRARSLYLPRVNAFARYDWNATSRPYAGDRSWTAGIMASWSPFAGMSEIAELQATSGREDAATAMAEAARERAALEVEQSANALRAALARLAISERAVRQSAEAHRIVARKYEGGLATVTELLDAAAIETQSALGHSAARYAAIVAGAERRKALGRDPSGLAA